MVFRRGSSPVALRVWVIFAVVTACVLTYFALSLPRDLLMGSRSVSLRLKTLQTNARPLANKASVPTISAATELQSPENPSAVIVDVAKSVAGIDVKRRTAFHTWAKSWAALNKRESTCKCRRAEGLRTTSPTTMYCFAALQWGTLRMTQRRPSHWET